VLPLAYRTLRVIALRAEPEGVGVKAMDLKLQEACGSRLPWVNRHPSWYHGKSQNPFNYLQILEISHA